MTLYLIDIASWQTSEKRTRDPLNLAVAKNKGVDLVNIKIGQGDWYGYRSWMRDYADKARMLGLGVSTFHWLDNSATGAAQAKLAFSRMKAIGGPDNMAHQCDCEDSAKPATERIWRDYVAAMQDYLGRPIVNYTGDWWWQPRGWKGSSLTPYLWAAPNKGYLGSYPGDTSAHWRAGYGGWGDYAVLQYAVSPIPGAGGGNLSKSAIRDPKVWAALTGQNQTPQEEDDMPSIEEIQTAVVVGVHRALDEAANRNTSTGRQMGDDIATLLKPVYARLDSLAAELAATKAAAETARGADPVAVARALIEELKPAA